MSKHKSVKPHENRLNKLEERVKKLENLLKSQSHINSSPDQTKQKAQNQPKSKNYDNNRGKNTPPRQQTNSKGPGTEAVADENLNAKTSKGVLQIPEDLIVKNELAMGDDLLVEVKNGAVSDVKVARRAKREIVEALVTNKRNDLYAVSKFNVHKLLPIDVQTKGVLKGFEVSLILPKEKEEKAMVAVIKDIESSGGHEVGTAQPAQPKHNPRVIEEDDLV